MIDKVKSIVKWGAIGGIGVAILGLITYILGVEYGSWLNYFGYAVLIAVVMAGSYEYRDTLNGGFARFGELFKHAILICLVYAVISTVWSIIFMEFIGTDLVAEVIEQTRMQLEEKGADEATIETSLNWTKKFMQPHFFALTSMFALMFVGALISLLTSSVLRKEKQEDDLIIDEIKEEN